MHDVSCTFSFYVLNLIWVKVKPSINVRKRNEGSDKMTFKTLLKDLSTHVTYTDLKFLTNKKERIRFMVYA